MNLKPVDRENMFFLLQSTSLKTDSCLFLNSSSFVHFDKNLLIFTYAVVSVISLSFHLLGFLFLLKWTNHLKLHLKCFFLRSTRPSSRRLLLFSVPVPTASGLFHGPCTTASGVFSFEVFGLCFCCCRFKKEIIRLVALMFSVTNERRLFPLRKTWAELVWRRDRVKIIIHANQPVTLSLWHEKKHFTSVRMYPCVFLPRLLLMSCVVSCSSRSNTDHHVWQCRNKIWQQWSIRTHCEPIRTQIWSLSVFTPWRSAAQLLRLNRKLHTEFTTGCRMFLCSCMVQVQILSFIYLCIYFLRQGEETDTWCYFEKKTPR